MAIFTQKLVDCFVFLSTKKGLVSPLHNQWALPYQLKFACIKIISAKQRSSCPYRCGNITISSRLDTRWALGFAWPYSFFGAADWGSFFVTWWRWKQVSLVLKSKASPTNCSSLVSSIPKQRNVLFSVPVQSLWNDSLMVNAKSSNQNNHDETVSKGT